MTTLSLPLLTQAPRNKYSKILRHPHRPVPPGYQALPPQATPVFTDPSPMPRVEVLSWWQEQFVGVPAQYYTVARPDTVVVMPLVRYEEFVLLEQLRVKKPVIDVWLCGDSPSCFIAQTEQQPHWQSSQTGFTAGKVDPGEDIFDAARRELREELGLDGTLTLVFMQAPAPGYDWIMYYFIATDLIHVGEQKLDPGEKIQATALLSADVLQHARQRTLRASGNFIEQLLISGNVRNALELDAALSVNCLSLFDVEQVGYWWMK